MHGTAEIVKEPIQWITYLIAATCSYILAPEMVQCKILSCNEMGHVDHLFISYFDMLGKSLLFPHSIDLDKLSQACKANTFLMQLSLKEFNEKLTSKHKKM